MKLSNKDVKILKGILNEILNLKETDTIKCTFGTLTMEEVERLYYTLKYAKYCEAYNKSYESLTDEDEIKAYECGYLD